MNQPNVYGFDVGRVLLEQTPESMAALFAGRYEEVPMIPGALETIRRLRKLAKIVRIVSFAGGDPLKEEHVRACLSYHGFLNEGVINKDDVFFVDAKAEKGRECRQRGVTQMVDDDQICVNAVRKAGVPCIWFGQPSGPGRCFDHEELRTLLGVE